MNVINLESLDGLPNKYHAKLSSFRKKFLNCEFLEELEKDYDIQELVFDIDQFCSENFIIGFHYTRADPKQILVKGLLSRTGKEIREDFLAHYGNNFTIEEINKIKKAWEIEFDDSDRNARDNWIYFNFTKEALINGGADSILRNVGGEQVFSPLYQLEKIKSKIQNLGVPLILKCVLNPDNIRTFIDYPWGKIAVSSYHRTINLHAHQTDQDGRQKVPVSPEYIEIMDINTFGNELIKRHTL